MELTDKQLREKVDRNEIKEKESSVVLSRMRERVLASKPAANQKFTFRSKKRMAPRPFELTAKRQRQGYSRDTAALASDFHVSTPTHGPAPDRASLESVSSIDSDLGKLKSEPSDSSDLFVLNAALDDLEDPDLSVSMLISECTYTVLIKICVREDQKEI